uniref:Uncharacterized protein n=1 Tax=uncultured marine crenarchaeote E37-7F TaxID=907717 RepID=G9BAP5_9ARCH|nr:hypothetical protein E37-7F_18 [uncultured marine crenarchaeote E37-7F]
MVVKRSLSTRMEIRNVKCVNITGDIEQKGKLQRRVELDFDEDEILNFFNN